MPSTSSGHQCPTCSLIYKDIQDHIRKQHPNTAYSASQASQIGLVVCNICSRLFKSQHGVSTHKQKLHRISKALGMNFGSSSSSGAPYSGSIAPTSPIQAKNSQKRKRYTSISSTSGSSPKRALHSSPSPPASPTSTTSSTRLSQASLEPYLDPSSPGNSDSSASLPENRIPINQARPN